MVFFSMEIPRYAGNGSGSGSGAGEGVPGRSVPPEVIGQMSTCELDARIREILHDEVAALFRDELPELFGSIKTAMVEYFDGAMRLSQRRLSRRLQRL